MRNDTSPAIPKPGLRTVFLVPTWRITCAFSHLAHHDGLQPTQQMGGLKPPPAGRLRRAKPSSLTQHHINELYLHRAPLCVRGTLGFAVCRVGRTRGGGLSDRDHALKGSPATDLATADEGGTKQTGTWAAFVQLRRHFVGADEGPRTPNLPITSAAPTVRGGPSYSC